jgi:DNA-binding transcriptional regulator YdaS (Cro superfamily)
MNLKTFFEISGRGSALSLCKALGVANSDMSNWSQGKKQVPAERCPAIEKATGGLVRCEDLRPDVEWGVLRGTEQRAVA